jgi:hypothetical protein
MKTGASSRLESRRPPTHHAMSANVRQLKKITKRLEFQSLVDRNCFHPHIRPQTKLTRGCVHLSGLHQSRAKTPTAHGIIHA